MVALASTHLIQHDAVTMHRLVIGQLREACHHKPSRTLLQLLAEEARGCVRHMLRLGVPHQLDDLASTCCEILEHATGQIVTNGMRQEAELLLREACDLMRAGQGTEVPPIDHILALGRMAARLPRLSRCTDADREALAGPITGLMLHLFG